VTSGRRRRGSSRLDEALVERGLSPNRSQARALVIEGRVTVDGQPARTPGQAVREDHQIEVRQRETTYASRGGEKLASGLDAFGVDPAGLIALDAGASTGGFTDCLLRRGARRVYAVDVGYGQLAWALRSDPRVVVLERTNARYLTREHVPEQVELVTADLSFISLGKVLPALRAVSAPGATFVVLVKPQFEVGPDRVGKGGVVRDDALRQAAADGVAAAARALGLVERGRVDSALAGPKGNREILLWLVGDGVP
jgi:23S rRNA (cytidine1920-2'-O)/16S rRNA (cytidine1409-2'-O)-methyltransferase